jgi:leucyl-tRNA synthetase
MYVGGAEHAVLHLLYARFITMALHDLGYLDFEEPFPHFRANGRITLRGGKMSKSLGNVVTPDEYIERHGADAFRTYMLFMGPYEAGGEFSDRGLGGAVRFLNRVWQFVTARSADADGSAPAGDEWRRMHATIQRVTADIEALKYNTAIAALMKYLNALEAQAVVTGAELRTLLLLLAPFAPFITEELWRRAGGAGSIHTARWPVADEAALRGEQVTLVVQVNGRMRDRITVDADLDEEAIQRRALEAPNARRHVADRSVTRVVYVPGRLVNIVVEE